MKKWKALVGALVIVLAVAWYAFRPEGLFIDRRVQEELPAANGGTQLQAVASGSFHSVVRSKLCRRAGGGLGQIPHCVDLVPAVQPQFRSRAFVSGTHDVSEIVTSNFPLCAR